MQLTANTPTRVEPGDLMVKSRNDLCSCGSGKKYKRCCMNKPSVSSAPQGLGILPAHRWRIAAYAILFIGVIVWMYRNSFTGAFLFDDFHRIIDNETLRSISRPWIFWAESRRPLMYLTFAANYAVGEFNLFGYHLINLIIHLCAGAALYGVIVEACRCLPDSNPIKQDAGWLGFWGALLWAAHPIQTQSVTYIIQRGESMMGLFYWLTLWSCFRYWRGPRNMWLALAIGFCILGAMSKQIILTAPFLVLLCDRTFVTSSWRGCWQRHRSLYIGLCMSWCVIGLLYVLNPEIKETSGFGYAGMSVGSYALTQPQVIGHYLRLAVWPAPLIIDYAWPPVASLAVALPSVFVCTVILLLTIKAYRRFPLSAFLVITFFILLAPSSSIFPIKDIAFEHRMYMPLACVILLFLSALHFGVCRWLRSRTIVQWSVFLLLSAIVAMYGIKTYQRNQDYQSVLGMWQNILTKRPDNARAHSNYGKYQLQENGNAELAYQHYKIAIELDDMYTDAYLNMGSLMAQLGRRDESVAYNKKVITLDPEYAIAYNNLGATLSDLERFEEAITYFEQALTLGFKRPGVHHNLGVAYAQTGQPHKAILHINESLRLEPNNLEARDHLNQIQQKLKEEAESYSP